MAVEPRLIGLAVANGYKLTNRVKDSLLRSKFVSSTPIGIDEAVAGILRFQETSRYVLLSPGHFMQP